MPHLFWESIRNTRSSTSYIIARDWTIRLSTAFLVRTLPACRCWRPKRTRFKQKTAYEILHLLRQRFECIVLDLPHTFDATTVAALDAADDILIVMTLDIPGIRSANRAIKVFNRLSYPKTKVHVVVNRWSKNIDVQLQKVEAHLDEQILGLIPNDYRKVMDSINLGQPLVESEPNSKITLEIKRIAALVSGSVDNTSTQPRKGLLRGMFGRQNSPGTTGTLQLSPMMDKA